MQIYGLDPILVKFFVTNDRDYLEISYFLENLENLLSESNFENDEKNRILHSTLICILEKLAIQSNFEDFFFLLEKKKSFLAEDKNDESFREMFITLISSVVQKHSSHLLFSKCIEIFYSKGYVLDTKMCNKIFELINNNKKEKEFYDYFFNFMV